MKHRLSVILVLAVILSTVNVYGQDGETLMLKDSTHLRKKDYNEQYDFENYNSAFPPKKKNMWSIGLNGGASFISGDVSSNLGWGAGLNIQKALGHAFSLRLQGSYLSTSGQDWRAVRLAGQSKFYRNYKTDLTDVSLQGVFHLNNINFHKKQPKVIFSLFGGFGFATVQTKSDIKDANGVIYDYSGIPDATTGSIFPKSGEIGKGDVKDALDQLQDGEYESVLPLKKTDLKIKDRAVLPSYQAGIGLGFRLGKRVDLNIEHRVSVHGSDLLDGTNEAVKNRLPVLSSGSDLVHYTSVGLAFKIGKREEPLYWVNPLFTPLDDVRDLKKRMDAGNFFQDMDDDEPH